MVLMLLLSNTNSSIFRNSSRPSTLLKQTVEHLTLAGPEVIKKKSCPVQLSMKFMPLINV